MPQSHPALNTLVAVLIQKILRRQLPPLRHGAQNLQHPVQNVTRNLGRMTLSVGPPLKPQQ